MLFFTKKKKTSVPLAEHRRIVSQLRDEIRRKDAIILDMRQQNEVLLSSSLKQAKKNDEMQVMMGRLNTAEDRLGPEDKRKKEKI